MYKYSNSPHFFKYGRIVDSDKVPLFSSNFVDLQLKLYQSECLYSSDDVEIITVLDGIALLHIQKEKNADGNFEEFVISGSVMLKKAQWFGIIALSPETKVSVGIIGDSLASESFENPYKISQIYVNSVVDGLYCYGFHEMLPSSQPITETNRYYELIYTEKGDLQLSFENEIKSGILDSDEKISVNEGNFILIPPKNRHVKKCVGDVMCHYLSILIGINEGQILDGLNLSDVAGISEADYFKEYFLHPLPKNRLLSQLLSEFVVTDASNSPLRGERLGSLTNLLFLTLLSSKEEQISKELPLIVEITDETLEEIIAYIDDNIMEPLRVDEICQKFGISRSTIQNAFREHLSVSPKSYINEKKLQKSKKLLKERRHSISEIAIMLGFASIHYFSRKFRARFKMTPTEYMKSLSI